MRARLLVLVGLYLRYSACDPVVTGYPSTRIEAIDVGFQNKTKFKLDTNFPLINNAWNFTCTVIGEEAIPSNIYWTIQEKPGSKIFKKGCTIFHYQIETGTNICNITVEYINFYYNHVFSCNFNNETAKMFTVISKGYEIFEPNSEVSDFRPTLSIVGTYSTEYSPGDSLELTCIVQVGIIGPVAKLKVKWILFNLTDGKPRELMINGKVKGKSIEMSLNYVFQIEDDGKLLICECTHEDYGRYGQKVIPLNLKITAKTQSATEQDSYVLYPEKVPTHEEDTEGNATTNTTKDSQEVSNSWKKFLVLGVVVSAVLGTGTAAVYALRRESHKQRSHDPQAQEEQRVCAMYALPTKTVRGCVAAEQSRSVVDSPSSVLEELYTNELYAGYEYDYAENQSVRSDASEAHYVH